MKKNTGYVCRTLQFSGLLMLMMAIFLFAGCYPTQKRDTAEIAGSSVVSEEMEKAAVTQLKDVPQTVQESTETTAIDAQVEIGNSSAKLTSLSGQGKQFSYDSIEKILSGGESFSQNTGLPEQNVQAYQGSNGGLLTLGPGFISYISGRSSLKQYSLVLNSGLPMDDRYIDNGVFTKGEIPGFDKQQTISQAKEWLREIGIEDVGEPKAAALDYETLSEQYENLDGDFPKDSEPFTPEDEGYYLVFRCEYDGIPFLAQNYVLTGKTQCSGSVIKMIVTRDGLQELYADGIYELQENNETFDCIYDFNQIIRKAETKFQDVMLDEPVKINRIELIYAPDVTSVNPITYKLSPCWVFYAASSSQSKSTDMFFYYSAITGEELGVE